MVNHLIVAIYFFPFQISASSMFVASMAFFAKVSDPAVGGTYMTLLNTLCNLGGNWPATAALWFVDPLTLRKCSTDFTNDCSTITEREVSFNAVFAILIIFILIKMYLLLYVTFFSSVQVPITVFALRSWMVTT